MILKLSKGDNQYDQEHIYTCEKIKQHWPRAVGFVYMHVELF